jgi:hypothetical protein
MVDLRVKSALARDAPDYDRKNVCPPCMYKVENEPLLKFSMLLAADGNQSLRLVDSAFLVGDLRPDDRALPSKRWLQPEEVDVFKDEVRNAKKAVSYKCISPLISVLTSHWKGHPQWNDNRRY